MNNFSKDENKETIIQQNDDKLETDKERVEDKSTIPPKARNKDYTYIW